MRTKNLNLKKKIAFIASVAMIATSSVAYMPASAAPSEGITVTAGTENTYGANPAVSATAINTFDVLIKLNGKYVGFKNSGEYKLYTTEAAAKNDAAEILTANHVFTTAAATNPFTGAAVAAAAKTNSLKPTAPLELPYFNVANPTVTFEFRARKGATLSSRSIESLEVELNDYGYAKVAKQSEYAVGYDDACDYDEATETENGHGEYEIVDLTGLVIGMSPVNAAQREAVGTAKVTKIGTTGVTTPDLDDNDATMPTLIDENLIKSDSYGIVKNGNVYAHVQAATLGDQVPAGTEIVVNTAQNMTWSASGAGINSAGEIKLTMGEDGYAVSNMVTFTKNGNKEYYVYVVKNPANTLAVANSDSEKDITISGGSVNTGLEAAASKLNGTSDGTAAVPSVKVKREITTKTVGNSEKFVTVYTIYNNDKGSVSTGDVYTITAGGTHAEFILPNGTLNLGNAGDVDTVTDGQTTLTEDAADDWTHNTVTVATAKANVITIDKTAPGYAESAIIGVTKGTKTEYIQIKFANDYKIKLHDQNDLTNPLATNDGTVNVSGTTVDQPADPEMVGFEFIGWSNKATANFTTEPDGTTQEYIYSVPGGNTQLKEDTTNVTPNTELYAIYKGLSYNVELDANGGYFDANGTNASKSEYVKYNGGSQPTKGTFTAIERKWNDGDINDFKAAEAVRAGYKFLGWSTNKDATKAMTTKEIAKAFPGKNETLKLYAVYEAKEDIKVNFARFDFQGTTNVQKITDGTLSDVKTNWTDAAGISAKFNKVAEGNKTVTVGEKFGALPTPILKGFEFDGWYVMTENNEATTLSATKITEDTIVDENVFAKQIKTGKFATGTNPYEDQGGTSAALGAGTWDDVNIYLFAKFHQVTYDITFDIGDGSWPTSEYSDSEKGTMPAMYKVSSAGDVTYYAANGKTTVTWETPAVGSGKYTEFTGWTINDNTTKYKSEGLVNAIKNMTTGSDLTIKASYKTSTTSKTVANINLSANEGSFYPYAINAKKNGKPEAFLHNNEGTAAGTTAFNDIQNANVTFTGYADDGNSTVDGLNADGKSVFRDVPNSISLGGQNGATANSAVSAKWKINDDTLEEVNGDYGYVVARAGYTFTGWYTDKECTQAYTFGNYPEAGKEVVLYAGWKENTSTPYVLQYDLKDVDGSLIQKTDGDGQTRAGATTNKNKYGLTFEKIWTAKTGDTVDIKSQKIAVKSGTGTNQTISYFVYDSKLSGDMASTAEVKASYDPSKLLSASFVTDKSAYSTVYGVYVAEGTQSEVELTAPTNVKVDGKKVTWTAADGAVEYQIVKIVGDKEYKGATSKTTSAELKNLPEETFKVKVIAKDAKGNTKESAATTVTVTAAELEAATNVAVTADGKVTWKAGKGAVKYQTLQIFADGTKKYSDYVTVTEKQLDATAQDFDLYVIAVGQNDKKVRSTKVAGKAFGEVAKLGTITDAKYDAKTKTVTWSAVDNAVKYQVLKVVNGKKSYGPYVENGTSYTFKSVPDGAFTYYVIAKDANGNSTRGTMNKVTNHPSVTDVVLAEDNKTVTFKAVEGAKAYQLCKIAPGKDPAYTAVFTGTTKSFSKACTSGTQVYVLAFFDDAHKDASYSETIIVK